jgi:two-component system chemotaxis sensor kinase CheA
VRAELGKPAKGTLRLNAFHDSGSIVIEVIDDGGGLPKEKILGKAIEKGLIEANAALSDEDITNLIFEPGFSTHAGESDITGRGVGMDVVRKNIQSLRGTVEVNSVEGEGATFAIRLPLTLAIIDGFLVGVDKSSFVIPLETVVECLELQCSNTDSHYLNLRGEVLPYVRLRELFEVEGQRPTRENIVVIKTGGHKAGIVVDTLLGEYQTVIKPLSIMFRHLRGIGGSTILGSGEVALILDVQALANLAAGAEEHSLAATGTHN